MKTFRRKMRKKKDEERYLNQNQKIRRNFANKKNLFSCASFLKENFTLPIALVAILENC